MNIYTSKPPMVETKKTFGGYVTAIHMDIRELTSDELQATYPDGFPTDPETGEQEAMTAWTATDYFLNHNAPQPDREKVKQIVDKHVNAKTDARILSGFQWNGINVWLSEENQRNFSEAQRVALMTNGQSLPVTFKLGEDAGGNPVYHEFTSVEELTGFYLAAVAFIQQCLAEGWQEKDSIDWSLYIVPTT